MEIHSFGFMRYDAGQWDGQPIGRVNALSYEDAAQRVAGGGLTLVACSRMQGVAYLVAKVWDGSGFYYAYRYPVGAQIAA